MTQLRYPFDRDYPITQAFGDNPRAYAPYGLKGHNGIDYATPVGTPVRAMHDGVVRYGGDGSADAVMGASAGLCVRLEGEAIQTGYAHLSRVYAYAGDKVQAGSVIGITGNTGASTGPHCHIEVLPLPLSLDNGYLGRTDPAPYLTETPAPATEGTPLPKEEAPLSAPEATPEEGPATIPTRKPRARKPRAKTQVSTSE